MSVSPQVVVVGSVNEDHVLVVDALPTSGETVLALASTRSSGGKGANQAVAAARAGARTRLVAALGSDARATRLKAQLDAHAVQTHQLDRVGGPSGGAVVTVDRHGDNCIVVEPGANALLTPAFVLGSLQDLRAEDVVLLQCEVPPAALRAAVTAARDAGATVILNWSPVGVLPAEVVAGTDVLVVNRGEALGLLAAHHGSVPDDADDATLATALAARFSARVVVTLGSQGAVCSARGQVTRVPAAPASAVIDSTGAGDTFAGTLAAAMAQGTPLDVAARRACAAASASVSTIGAQPAPTTHDIPLPTSP